MMRSDSALKAVDEQGTKFVIIDSQPVDAYLLQSPTSTSASVQSKTSSTSTKHKRVSSGSNSKQASTSCKLKSDKNAMEFNMWMFQQNQASFAAMSSTPPPCPVPPVPPPPPTAPAANRNTSCSNGDTTSSGNKHSANNSNVAPPSAPAGLPFMIPPPPNGMIPPPTMLPPPPGFEAIPLVLPAPPPPFNYFKNTLESSSVSSSCGTTNSSSKKSESTSSSDHKQQRKRSDREFKHIKQLPKNVESSDGEFSPDVEQPKSKSRTNKSDKQSSNTYEENSRKRKRTRERSSSWSQERKRSKDSKKAKKAKKEKKQKSLSKKKSKSSSKILVAEVAKNGHEDEDRDSAGGGGCCDNWMQEFYEEEVTLSDEEEEEGVGSALSSISNSSLSSSETSDEDNSRSEGEISGNNRLAATRRTQNCRSSSKDRAPGYKIPKKSSRTSKSTVHSENHHRSESDSRHRYSSYSLDGNQISRRYSRRRSSSPEDTASRSDRRRVRREDNERLENSLQEFRQRKGMSRYNTSSHQTSSKFSPGSRYSNPPFIPMGSATSSFPSSSFFPNKSEKKSSKNDDGSSNGDDGGDEDKHPLAGDDVSPMDRARIENYLKGCQQRYTYKSCGQIAFYDSHCHIDFLFKKTGYKKTYKQFRSVVPFPENYGGCVAVFCEPHAFSKFSIVEKVLEEENLVACFGCHPHSSNLYNNVLENNIRRMMSHPKVRAWGECGLDYSDRSRGVDKEIQQYVFRRQLKCAVELKMPLCVHSRQSDEDLFEILREEVPPDWKIHRHCYTESPEMALKMIEYFPNMYIGFTNVISYNNATDAIATACAVPLDRVLLETDAPYFLPPGAPKSMKNSNPGMAIQVAERLSLLKSVPIEEVLKKTRQNLLEMYGL